MNDCDNLSDFFGWLSSVLLLGDPFKFGQIIPECTCKCPKFRTVTKQGNLPKSVPALMFAVNFKLDCYH